MTPDQWTAVLSQLGVGGVLILVLVKVIVPMVARAFVDSTKAIDRLAEATDRNTAAVSSLGERMARIEGAVLYQEHMTPPVGVPSATSPSLPYGPGRPPVAR